MVMAWSGSPLSLPHPSALSTSVPRAARAQERGSATPVGDVAAAHATFGNTDASAQLIATEINSTLFARFSYQEESHGSAVIASTRAGLEGVWRAHPSLEKDQPDDCDRSGRARLDHA